MIKFLLDHDSNQLLLYKIHLGEVFKKWYQCLIAARNSTTKPKCRRCRTGYYCVGDGTEEKCGVTSPTEFSFGGAQNCSACPEGWVRFDGILYLRTLKVENRDAAYVSSLA